MCPQLAPRRPERRFPAGTGRDRSVQPIWLDFRCGSGSPNLLSRSTFTVQPEDRITYPAVAAHALRRLGEPESWTLVEWINVPGPGAPHRF